ncbi:MAG: class I SAM-dependent methyltransferase [Richelia sp. RM1_1_1]|nr:class I SAM-dependent methyltransferase [Richelia sp. SM1_7_0]NJN13135.1 class I SAM-dependent methyltransferase [Richelia sp. RM1_1_1]
MSLINDVADYNPIVPVYTTFIEDRISVLIIQALEKLMLQYLSGGAHILDIGCADGEIVKQLHVKGYQASGIDTSEEFLRIARVKAPESKFVLGDIREFESSPIYDGVFSKDVFCHFLSLEELITVFRKVYTIMRDNGIFVFTMPTAELPWRETLREGIPDFENFNGCTVNDKYVFIERSHSHDRKEKIRESQYIAFELINDVWKRSDTAFLVKDYFVSEIKSALENVGFIDINVYDTRDFGDNTPISQPCFVCRKPSVSQ